MKATVLTHAGIEGPGLLEDILKERGVKYETVDATTQKIPETDVIIAMGGPMSANDSYRWLISEVEAYHNEVEEVPTTADKVIQGFIENSDYYHGAVNRIFGRFLDTACRKKE